MRRPLQHQPVIASLMCWVGGGHSSSEGLTTASPMTSSPPSRPSRPPSRCGPLSVPRRCRWKLIVPTGRAPGQRPPDRRPHLRRPERKGRSPRQAPRSKDAELSRGKGREQEPVPSLPRRDQGSARRARHPAQRGALRHVLNVDGAPGTATQRDSGRHILADCSANWLDRAALHDLFPLRIASPLRRSCSIASHARRRSSAPAWSILWPSM